MAETMSAQQCQGLRAETGHLMCHITQYDQYVSYKTILGVHIGYLLLVYALVKFMANRKPFGLKWAMFLYNTVQIAVCAVMAVSLAPMLLNWFFNLNGPCESYIEFWVFVHYLAKNLDMVDTVWMALRKKNEQITFLHIYHHATTGLMWGLMLSTGNGCGASGFGAWLNSVVHLLVYSHYLITSMGIHNPLKKYITQIQMLQFVLCMAHAVLFIFFEKEMAWEWGLLELSYHITLFMLFMRFYNSLIVSKLKEEVRRKMVKKKP